ncbi:hypothetical protein DPMN_144773 [Dreissena polymorpha]|uniref:Uncharacterized protein n=1 Tax=Dreissena polymorpha TaxID=45954 RepID=A0A9D4F2R3_DREPO|nr:hypothetical protein DPMN_144773 [Dreissena polymorpha]
MKLNERPRPSLSGSAITVTEQLARKCYLGRIGKMSCADIRFPIGSTTLSVFQSLESTNKPSPSQWKAPRT